MTTLLNNYLILLAVMGKLPNDRVIVICNILYFDVFPLLQTG